MNSPTPETTAAQERCQYRTPAGRRCALHILDPRSSFCPRHASAQIPDSQDFSALILKHAGDFDDCAEIKHALASLFKLLASGRITSRRAKALAYIASLLLRTIRDSNALAANQGVEIAVTPRDRDIPPENSPSPSSGGITAHNPSSGGLSSNGYPSNGHASNGHAPQSTVTPTVPIPAAPSVHYGAPIHPYTSAPTHRSQPLPTRRHPHHPRASAIPTPAISPRWKPTLTPPTPQP